MVEKEKDIVERLREAVAPNPWHPDDDTSDPLLREALDEILLLRTELRFLRGASLPLGPDGKENWGQERGGADGVTELTPEQLRICGYE